MMKLLLLISIITCAFTTVLARLSAEAFQTWTNNRMVYFKFRSRRIRIGSLYRPVPLRENTHRERILQSSPPRHGLTNLFRIMNMNKIPLESYSFYRHQFRKPNRNGHRLAYGQHSVNNGAFVKLSLGQKYGLTSIHKKDSSKTFFFGHDDRHAVSPVHLGKFPFSNVVRLSAGCTGTLLTPLHVLTAAHCLHDGERFKTNVEHMKVEIPGSRGYETHYADGVNIPLGWLTGGTSGTAAERSIFDYAVIELVNPVSGRRNFMKLVVPGTGIEQSKMYFLGYDFTSAGNSHMWKSSCLLEPDYVAYDGQLILSHCDSVVGNSGSAVFASQGMFGFRVIGIISNAASASSDAGEGKFVVINRLTWPKVLDICSALSSEGRTYGVCPDIPRASFSWHQMAVPPRTYRSRA